MKFICDGCQRVFDIPPKSHEINKRNHNGLYICRSCAAIRRSSNPEYLKRILRKGKNHWAFGIKGQKNKNFGKPLSDERKRRISESKKRILPCGLTVSQEAARRAAQTARDNGSYKTRAVKAAITKEKNNSWVTYRTKHYKGFYYRSSLERRFLGECEQRGELSSLRNCDFSIPYMWGGAEHHYIPDYLDSEKGILFEIKSCWTWDGRGKNSELKALNKCKLTAARNEGYGIRLIIYRQLSNGKYQEPEIYNYEQMREI